MSAYRIYPLDGCGRIQTPLEVECPDDGEAILHARGLGSDVRHGCEVWRVTRFVGRFHFQGLDVPAAAGARAAGTELAL